ncbi:hypothetical protein D3C86_1763200 [compost metagenome]
MGQAEEPDEQLHQQRRAAKQQQICAAQAIDNAPARIEPAHADHEAHDARQQQGAGSHLDGDHRAPHERVEIGEDGSEFQVHLAGASNHLFTMAW